MKLKVKYFNKYILPSIILLNLIKYKLIFQFFIHTYYFMLIFLKILKKKYEVLLKFEEI